MDLFNALYSVALSSATASNSLIAVTSSPSVSDIIQLIGIIASSTTSIVAIIISVAALNQNSKMIEESSRPVISIYFDYSQMGEPTGYFVVKNFGSSAAMINCLSYNEPIKKHPTTLADLPSIFDGLIGNTIAPGQKFLAPFKLYEYNGGKAIFDITYKSSNKSYSDHFEIDVDKYAKLVKPRLQSKEYKSISYPIQEIAERLM